MHQPPSEFPLPTLDHLGVKEAPAKDLDAKSIVTEWFTAFASNAQSGNVKAIMDLFYHESYWRDLLALTWDFRTFIGPTKIAQFLYDRLAASQLKALELQDDSIQLQLPFPDLAWIQFTFTFEVSNTGTGSGIGRLVPQPDGRWKANCMFTNLEGLKGSPEQIGALRDTETDHGFWERQRKEEIAFKEAEPTVLVIGGSLNGLVISARLKVLNVSTLIVEQSPRIGDAWRKRYETLSTHDPIHMVHLPYLPFPSTWPEYTPAYKMANWLEAYADSLDLNYWTSSAVTKVEKNKVSGRWTVHIQQGGKQQVFTQVKHVVLATGFAPTHNLRFPSIPGMETYQGQTLHSTQYKSARDYVGKKVVVIGSSASGHDIAADFVRNGNDTTMIQRGPTFIMSAKNGWTVLRAGMYNEDGPPVDVADRIGASFPYAFLLNGMFQRQVDAICELDKDLLAGLKACGFKFTKGRFDAGPLPRIQENLGGIYIDTGASKLVINGSIKLKNDSTIESFTNTGLKFANGSELQADVVIFATGYGSHNAIVHKLCDEETAQKCKTIWGVDEEGELRGCWRDLGVPGLWFMTGGLALCRFWSKHLALQIKAIEEGKLTSRYSLP